MPSLTLFESQLRPAPLMPRHRSDFAFIALRTLRATFALNPGNATQAAFTASGCPDIALRSLNSTPVRSGVALWSALALRSLRTDIALRSCTPFDPALALRTLWPDVTGQPLRTIATIATIAQPQRVGSGLIKGQPAPRAATS